MINKIKSTKRTESFSPKQWLLSLILFSVLIQNVFCKSITESNQKKNKTIISLPKIIVLQTHKDWSSRLGTNQTTPQTTSLVFEESQEVRTTDYGSKQRSLVNSTEKTTTDLKDSVMTASKLVPQIITKTDSENKTNSNGIKSINSNQIDAHNVAAQVLSRILHITPLLALASNGVPHRRLNYSRMYKPEQIDDIQRIPSGETLNEIDVDSDVNRYKPERMSASGISFPTTPSSAPITTELNIPIFDSTPTEPPPEYIEHSPHGEDDHDHHESGEQEEDEQTPSEDQEDYEDDDEMESFRYPVKVNFPDNDDYSGNDREGQMPFVIPNIDLNPESLKQKGCRTVVKEVQAIPVMKGIQNQNNQNPNNVMKRTKRHISDNSRKFTSIVMTKECHFPGDEGASSEAVPLTIATTAASKALNSDPNPIYQTPTPPSYDDYDEDFDFRPQYPYPSKRGLVDRMETKPSNDRRSYADNPIFRRDNSEEFTPKEDFGFDDKGFYDFKEENNNQMKKRKTKKRPQKKPLMSSDSYFDDEDFGAHPKKRKNPPQNNNNKPPVYRNDRGDGDSGGGGRDGGGRSGGRTKGGKKKPKKINRSFAFFRRAEPKDKDPNESDYAVSYGRGNFQSFSDSYDSDKDGPRKKGQRVKESDFDDDDD